MKDKNIHEGHRERLRKKFDADPEMRAMLDHEVVEYILSLVIPRKDTNEIAHNLMEKFGSMHGLLTATPKELKEVKNMTVSASYLIASMYSVIRRALRTKDYIASLPDFSMPYRAIEYMQPFFMGRKTECILLLYLDLENKLINQEWIEGPYVEKITLCREGIVKRAVREGASLVLLGHNHPTGNLSPSNDDIKETAILYGALKNVNARLADSIIFNDFGYFSFKSNGIIDKCELEWLHDKDEPSNLQSPDHFNINYRTEMREFLLDYYRLRETGEIKAVDKEDIEPLPEEELYPKKSSKRRY